MGVEDINMHSCFLNKNIVTQRSNYDVMMCVNTSVALLAETFFSTSPLSVTWEGLEAMTNFSKNKQFTHDPDICF
jgi:hypothetical protein